MLLWPKKALFAIMHRNTLKGNKQDSNSGGGTSRSAMRGAHTVRGLLGGAADSFHIIPLVLFLSTPPALYEFPGEPVCCGCGIGRQARLRWLSR